MRSPGLTSTRQRVTLCVPVCAPVERVAQLVGVQTGKEGKVSLTAPSSSRRFESWDNAFVGKVFHHGGDEAVHAIGDDFF